MKSEQTVRIRPSRMLPRGKVAVAVAVASALAVLGAPTAMAQSGNTVELRKAGVTRLTLAPGAANALSSLGVSVTPIRPSKVGHSGAIRFPITSGEIDPSTAAGVINHSGGLRLSAGGTVVRLRNFRIRSTTLSAAVGGDRVPIIKLGLGNAKTTRPGLGTKVSNVAVRLNKTGADALNAAFGTTALKAGFRLGTAVVDAKPRQLILESGNTTLTPDAGTVGVLTGAGITPGLVPPAAANSAGAFAFPITKSKVRVNLVRGTIKHSGGISLTRGATVAELTNFDIKLGAEPTLAANVAGGAEKVDILNLDLSDARTRVRGLRVRVSGVVAKINKAASDTLTTVFGLPATEGATLGTAVVAAKVR
jgi:hypothetical protein